MVSIARSDSGAWIPPAGVVGRQSSSSAHPLASRLSRSVQTRAAASWRNCGRRGFRRSKRPATPSAARLDLLRADVSQPGIHFITGMPWGIARDRGKVGGRLPASQRRSTPCSARLLTAVISIHVPAPFPTQGNPEKPIAPLSFAVISSAHPQTPGKQCPESTPPRLTIVHSSRFILAHPQGRAKNPPMNGFRGTLPSWAVFAGIMPHAAIAGQVRRAAGSDC